MEAIDASVIFGSASRRNPARKSRFTLLVVTPLLKTKDSMEFVGTE
jgi:hypothetical protein